MVADTPTLAAQHLCKTFGGLTATNDVSLNLHTGARHALIGPNGAGKTTLINLLTGVLPPTSGQISLHGIDITHMAPHRRVKQGLVRTFQINQLFEPLTPLQTLALAVSQKYGLGSKLWQRLGKDVRVNRRCEELLERFRLTDVLNQPTRELPYGQRRQLEIAVALACEPSVLLLDEPVAGVPAGERDDLLRILDELPDEVAVLLIEHDMDLVFSFAKSMTVLVNGTILVEGDPDSIANSQLVQDAYLGHSAAHTGSQSPQQNVQSVEAVAQHREESYAHA